MLEGEMMKKKKVALVGAIIVVMSVVVANGLSYMGAIPPETNSRLAVIEDEKGDRIGVEPVSDEVWSKLVELFHSKEMMWIGGVVEVFIFIRPDPNYPWGFRFKPENITVAEATAEGLQTTIRDISEDVDYWIRLGQAYVFAKVVDYSLDIKMQISAQLSPDRVFQGDNVTVSAIIKDDAENLIEGATVTATIGDLEILFLLADQGNGDYQGTIDTSIVKQGTYTIVVTAQKEGYEPSQSSLTVAVTCMHVTEFRAVVNGMKSVDVRVCVDISDGVTEAEAELIVGTTFIVVMREYVTHRLDTLTFDDTQIEAHYTWGVDENDIGHVLDMTADLATLQITVDHCF